MARYRYALVACARWEEHSIEEWLEYHKSIGFEHVYLYSNDDDPSALLQAASAYVRGTHPFVTFRHWPRAGDQVAIYLDFLDTFKSETDWFSFLDIDEFFVFRNLNNVHAFMQDYGNEADCLYFNWVLFGNDGHVQRPAGPILGSHQRRAARPDVHTKMLCRSEAIVASEIRRKVRLGCGAFWHFLDNYKLDGVRCRDVLHQPTDGYSAKFPASAEPFVTRPNFAEDVLARAYIAHFQFKSEEDFIRRWRRGGFAIDKHWQQLHQSGAHKNVLASRNAVHDDYLAEYWRNRGNSDSPGAAGDPRALPHEADDDWLADAPGRALGPVGICAIFLNEAHHLLEWIAYHLAIGFDYLVLFDNDSTDGSAELVAGSIFAPFVTLIDWPQRPGQLAAYQHFCDHHARSFEWVAFIDTDEFVHPLEHNSIRDILPRYEDASCVQLQWLNFGSSGHMARPPGLTIESYDMRLPEDDPGSGWVKSLARGRDLVGTTDGPHTMKVTGRVCNARGETVRPIAHLRRCHDVVVLNHFFTRSEEDWIAKSRRGYAMRQSSTSTYQNEVYANHNRAATVRDDRIKRFAPLVRETLAAGPARAMLPVRFDGRLQPLRHWLRPSALRPRPVANPALPVPPAAPPQDGEGPVIHLEPNGGRLANRMIQYMAAMKLASLVPGCRMSNIRLPDWGIDLPPIDTGGESLTVNAIHQLDMDGLSRRMNAGEIRRLTYIGYGQRMANLLDREQYRGVFQASRHRGIGYGADHLVCHVRADDVLRVTHPDYVLTPIEFFQETVARTGLRPVFMGETGPGLYMDRLREAFPLAEVRPKGGIIEDFETIRQSENILVSCSTFCWLASWLSDAKLIILPVNGMLHPRQGDGADLLPLDDPRYRFHLFPINFAVPDAEHPARHQMFKGLWREVTSDYLRQLLAEAPRVPHRIEPFLELFDEHYYVSRFPTVRQGIADGWLDSGLAHFKRWGFQDGLRWWSFDLDECWYTTEYPMAALEIAQGDYADCRHHYVEIGRRRGYRPLP